eukprot:3179116-Rhodomonas_salina.6
MDQAHAATTHTLLPGAHNPALTRVLPPHSRVAIELLVRLGTALPAPYAMSGTDLGNLYDPYSMPGTEIPFSTISTRWPVLTQTICKTPTRSRRDVRN